MSDTITATFTTNSATGRAVTITQASDDTWTGGGLTVGPCTEAVAAGYFSAHTLDGDTAPAPVIPVVTTISALEFIRRFTTAELAALIAANPLWGYMVAAAGTIDVTDPVLVIYLQEAVTAGALTIARQARVLDLTQVSP